MLAGHFEDDFFAVNFTYEIYDMRPVKLYMFLKLQMIYYYTLDVLFQSVTFTNGGMHYAQIGFRLSQRLLMYPTIGNVLQKFRNLLEVSGYVSKETIKK